MNFASSLLNNSAPNDKTALLTQQGDSTYQELREQAFKVAANLNQQGLNPGDRVLLLGESSLFWVQAYLGIALAGGVSVPQAVPANHEFLRSVVQATQPRMAFIQAKWLRRLDLESLGCEVIFSEARPPRLETEARFMTTAEMETPPAFEAWEGQADDLAAIMFTSGSTATPRGVMVSHGNIVANTEDIIASLDIGPDDRMMAVLPFYYCFGTSLLHTHLMAGASLVVDNRFLFPEKVLQNLIESRCTSLAGVPSTYQILLRRSNLKTMEFPNLVKIQQAGGKLAQLFIDELEEALPQAQVFIMYGQTEATARLSCISPEERHAHPGSIGRGLARTRLSVLDENDQPVQPGVVGEIVATGPNITLGYWNNSEATTKVFSGGLHTGDLATVDDSGYIKIVDRARDFLKCGGKRVSAKQIEETLLAFDGMTEVAVVGVQDMVLGEAVYLFAVHPDGESCAEELKKFCEKELDRTLLPKGVEFLDGLPQNNSGKPDKLALKKKLNA